MGSAAERMKKMGDKLDQRTKESYNRKDEYGPSFTYFKKTGMVKRADGGEKPMGDVSIWKVQAGVHIFDIVPTFAGPNWSLDNHGVKLQEGEPVYVLDILVHQNVGANDAQFVCLSRNFGLPCPVCEHQAELKKEVDYDQDLIKGLYPRRRNVYNVVVYDNAEEEEKGVQILEASQFYLEAKLTPLALDARTKALIPYAHYERGKTVQFEARKTSFDIGGTKRQGLEYIGHKFLDRNYSLADPFEDGGTVLDDAYILDDLIYIPTYEEVFEAYWAGIKELPADGGDQSGGRRRRGTTAAQTATGPAPVEKQSEQPSRGRRKPVQEPVQEKESSGDDSARQDCPYGGKFGEDIDNLEGCNTCEIYDSCALKMEELKEKAPQPQKSEKASDGGGGRLRRRPGA